MRIPKLSSSALFLTGFIIACNNNPEQAAKKPPASGSDTTAALYKEENITFNGDNVTMDAYVVYDENSTAKRPAVLVVPEWWGLNDYPKMRARMLARLGYVAMAIDLYGNGKVADNPDSAKAFATPFYKNPASAKARIDAAIAKLKTHGAVDTANIGAIGYCFGGGVLLNAGETGR